MHKRNVLWWLFLFLLICNTLVTLNLNIAIVSMVESSDNLTNSTQVCPNTTIFLRNMNQCEKANGVSKRIGYKWSASEQNIALSGYHWLSYFSIMPGGLLSHKFGGKRVAGYAQVISSVMSSLIPITAEYGHIWVSWIRAVQGLLSFMSVPAALYTLIGNWVPPQERGKFVVTFLVGSCSGFFFGSFIFGYISEFVHWQYVFHITSICGIIWSIFWFYLIHDSPQQHPNISLEEKKYIEESLSESLTNNRESIPWKQIVTSVPFIVCTLSMSSWMWLFVVFAVYTPIYFKTIYGLNANEIGILTSFPQLVSGLLSFGFGIGSDTLLKKNVIRITNLRKLGSVFGSLFAVFPLLIIPFYSCNINLAIWGIIWCTVIKACGAFGTPLVLVDISPKFCGILEGFSGTFSSLLTVVISTYINHITKTWEINDVWNFTFFFSAIYAILTNALFWIFGSADVQPWNFETTEKEKKRYK